MTRTSGPSGWALAGALTGHCLLGFAWLVVFLGAVFLTSSYTGLADLILVIGGLCWLGALPVIVMGWQSGSYWYWGVPVAWTTVFAIATAVVVASSQSSSTESGPPPPGTACSPRSPQAESGQRQAAGRSQGAALIAFDSDRDGTRQIYVMNADGSHQRRLTQNEGGSNSPAWSPDGTRIAFARFCAYGSGRHDWREEIFVMNADGSDQRRLTQDRSVGSSPAWSPDGTRIAFISYLDGFEWSIVVMNADGSSQRMLTGNTSALGDLTWSPDGKQMAFVWSDQSTIYVMNSDGSGQRALTHAYSDDPAWSPTANRIAFRKDAESAIYTMSPDGSAQRRLTHGEDDRDPAWASDATKIAFSSYRDGNYEVFVMNADGSGLTQLTDDSADDGNPAWQATPRHP